MVGIRNFQNTFETRKRSFISAFSIYMTVPLSQEYLRIYETVARSPCFVSEINFFRLFKG